VKLLVLGGTQFLGRHIAAEALERRHQLTLFTRGRTRPGLFPAAEHLTGDRDGGLHALRGGSWDVVVDCSGYLPRVVADSARLLAAAVERYVFISSVSVYPDYSRPGVDESAAVATIEDETVEQIDEHTYGPLKALCERAVEEALPGRALVIRPGLIVGPDDPTDRFTYWPVRIAGGGRVLAPGDPSAPAQWIDVRDLAAFVVDQAEHRSTGVVNAVGPAQPATLGELLDTCVRELAPPDTELCWVDDAFLADQEVEPWSDLPLYLGGDPSMIGFEQISGDRARAAGLRHRPVADTVRDTLAWHRQDDGEVARWGFKLSREREAELLASYRNR
jgi:2'-hydroxyisoflavone reductase